MSVTLGYINPLNTRCMIYLLGAVAPLGLAMSVLPSFRPLTLLKYDL